jgi:hypothetical protein
MWIVRDEPLPVNVIDCTIVELDDDAVSVTALAVPSLSPTVNVIALVALRGVVYDDDSPVIVGAASTRSTWLADT